MNGLRDLGIATALALVVLALAYWAPDLATGWWVMALAVAVPVGIIVGVFVHAFLFGPQYDEEEG